MIMKKKTIRILVSVFVILLVFRLMLRTGDKLILSDQNKDRTYSIFIYEVGAPEFPFGEGRCEIVLKKGNITIENQEIIVYNDGKRLVRDNFKYPGGNSPSFMWEMKAKLAKTMCVKYDL